MSIFVCKNEKCPKFGVKEEHLSNTYKYVDGKLISNHAICPACGEIRDEINPNNDIPLSEKNIGIGKYTMASTEERKEMLKKRSHEHYEKEIKPYKEYQLHQAVKNFNDASK